MAEFAVRPLRPEDTPAVLELMRAALGETPVLRRTPELFDWKHHRNPFGPSVALVAERDGLLVGLRTFMRWDLRTADGITVRCVRAVDTATHPDHRRRGIFRRLTMEALDAARAAEIRLVFNTPNASSRPGYLKMGWRPVGPIRVMVRPRLGGAVPPDGGTVAPEAALPGGSAVEPERLPTSVPLLAGGPPASVHTPRTAEYLRWRYTAHPTAAYRMYREGDGAVLLRANVRGGRSEAVVSELLGEAAGALRRAAADARTRYVVGTLPPGSPARRAAWRAGMLSVPRVAALHLVARPLDELPFDPFRPEAWRFVFGDLELL